MQQVEIEVAYPALFQLLLKDGGGAAPGGGHMAGKLRGQQIALAGIIRQDAAHDALGFALVVGVGGVEVVQAVLHGIVHHFTRFGLVHPAGTVRKQRQAHGAKAQKRQTDIMKHAGHHRRFPSLGSRRPRRAAGMYSQHTMRGRRSVKRQTAFRAPAPEENRLCKIQSADIYCYLTGKAKKRRSEIDIAP